MGWRAAVGEPPRSRGGEAGEEAMWGRVSDSTKVGTGWWWWEEGLDGVAAGVVVVAVVLVVVVVVVVCMDREVDPLERGEEEAVTLAGD